MPDTKTLEFSRTLPLPPEKLWPVLTLAKHRETWGAPDADTVLEVEKEDTRVGGHERHRCGPADDPMFLVDTRWYRLDGPHHAVYTETLIFQGETAFTSLVTYEVTATGDGSKLDLTVAVSAFGGEEMFAEVEQGWEGGLANLASLVEKLAG